MSISGKSEGVRDQNVGPEAKEACSNMFPSASDASQHYIIFYALKKTRRDEQMSNSYTERCRGVGAKIASVCMSGPRASTANGMSIFQKRSAFSLKCIHELAAYDPFIQAMIKEHSVYRGLIMSGLVVVFSGGSPDSYPPSPSLSHSSFAPLASCFARIVTWP